MTTKTALRPPDTTERPRKVALGDRIALRIGLALIVWSRRTRRIRPAIDHETRLRLERERREQEAALYALTIGMQRWR